jgi:tRNA dimethylallyltransferase
MPIDPQKPPIIFLMGPTASGKTDLAIDLSKELPLDIISVDSAMVYKGMDIGTAKPSAEELAVAPHRLIDIRDPAESYSVADFCEDAHREIEAIVSKGRIPILVGGTMMYFKALLDGLADMPASNAGVRQKIVEEAKQKGWPALHGELMKLDPDYASQLHPNHSQRIARALEVYRISGKTMSEFRKEQSDDLREEKTQRLSERFSVMQFALVCHDRKLLHQRIQTRFEKMLEQGFINEVKALRTRGDLNVDLPAMRAVGYRQVWQYLETLDVQGEVSEKELLEKGTAATRQLAKRQLTWLREWPHLHKLFIDKTKSVSQVKKNMQEILNF